MNKRTVKIGFADFWGLYEPTEGYIYRTLSKKYNITIDNDDPDFLFFSTYGCDHLDYKKAVKIFFTHENVFPNFNLCDYSLSFLRDGIGGRNLYLPVALLFDKHDIPPFDTCLLNRRFCNFIYSQESIGGGARLRKQVCQELMKYRLVDCPGRVLHNMDALELSDRKQRDWNATKINFLKNYKFTIAFENTNSDGYITEKLIDPLLAGSVPIYWGSAGNVFPFSKDCMIYANDYHDIDSLIARIKEVDENDELYMSICNANPIRNGALVSLEETFLKFFDKIYEAGPVPLLKDELKRDTVAQVLNSTCVRKAYNFNKWYQKQTALRKFIGLLRWK